MRRPLAAALAAVLAAAACGPPAPPAPPVPRTVDQLFNPMGTFARLGRLTGSGQIPFIGDMAFVAGPGDTVFAVLALSLENRALAFRRDGRGFAARYRVDVSLQQAGRASAEFASDETVRVETFAETSRAEESVLWQRRFALRPGPWRVGVLLRDLQQNTVGQATADLEVPSFREGGTSDPIVAYDVVPRERRRDSLAVVLNPRAAAAFGGTEPLTVYVEGYGYPGPARVPFEVRTEQDSVIRRDTLRFRGGREVEGQVVRLPPDSLALGTLRLVVDTGAARRSVTTLVSFSPSMVLTNVDEMLNLLRYFGEEPRLDQVRKAPDRAERARLWRELMRDTDPDPTTPENEALNQYFTRLAIANQRYRDEGTQGWLTDRGEVFIQIGDPDEQVLLNQSGGIAVPGDGGARILRWTYINYRAQLFFIDATGFGGRYRLTPASRAELRRIVQQVRRIERDTREANRRSRS